MRGPLLSLLAICMLPGTARAEDRVRPAIDRAIPLLEFAAAGSADQRECFTCHSQGLPILALSEARLHGFAIDEANFQRQVDHTYAHLERNRDRYAAGEGTGGNADTAGYALWALAAGDRAPDETTSAVTEYLLTWQSDEAHWSCTSHRPPSEASNFTTNYVSLRGLNAFGTDDQEERISARVQCVAEWLNTASTEDNEDRVFRLRALELVEAGADVISAAADDLLSRQRSDGGWSQLDDLESDPYATATALVALHQTGYLLTTDDAYLQGLEYLLETQHEDGSWHVTSRSDPFQTYYESGFPHGKDQFISTSASAWAVLALLPACPEAVAADASQHSANPQWSDGPLSDENFFPLAVWLQAPANAAKYKAAGINTYVALWRGPTDEQLAELAEHGMRVICDQNAVGLEHVDDPVIIGWMHGDEPDNAQPLRGEDGYGPPISPETIVTDYESLRAADPSRPVLLNLGQGVAWDGWYGRGVRTNHPEDYPGYVQGADIVSFDIYPACHDHPDVAGKLWMVADGVTRLREWSEDRKPVWTCIETTRIGNESAMATPQQVRAEVWMSLVRGSRGIIYFCHQFEPEFIEAGLLAEPEILAAVTQTNQQIQRLAPVLNSPTLEGTVAVESAAEAPVEAICKQQGSLYVFAVAMRGAESTATFRVPGLPDGTAVDVIDEDRTLEIRDGMFQDDFTGWGVHLYRINAE